MMDVIQQLREQAKKLLEGKKVDMVIGFGEGTELARTTPVFITNPEEVSALTWGPLCANNLVKYLLDYQNLPGNIAVVVKGCDSRAINRLVTDNQINRDKVVVLGVPCPGQLDWRVVAAAADPAAKLKGFSDDGESFTIKTDAGDYRFDKKESMLPRCLVCENPNPVVSDITIGKEQPVRNYKERFADVIALEQLGTEEKSAYWDKQFSRCLRCYACRNVCPVCTCRTCVFDQMQPMWVSKRNNLSENTAFHLIRAFHVAGRCIDCGECDRVCPVDIPLRNLNQKIQKDLKDLFNAPTPGSEAGLASPLGEFATGDPEEFM
ncbi:MAG: dehydrogenase [Peptococcaceae bacterium]|jgi:ferredoxin|nr:dehydrogenase [Peptococcaceae bacterium]